MFLYAGFFSRFAFSKAYIRDDPSEVLRLRDSFVTPRLVLAIIPADKPLGGGAMFGNTSGFDPASCVRLGLRILGPPLNLAPVAGCLLLPASSAAGQATPISPPPAFG